MENWGLPVVSLLLSYRMVTVTELFRKYSWESQQERLLKCTGWKYCRSGWFSPRFLLSPQRTKHVVSKTMFKVQQLLQTQPWLGRRDGRRGTEDWQDWM